MYDLVAYGSMIADAGRMSAYSRALEARVAPGAVVLDVGTGPGIMALFACRAGAARVYAVEPSDVIQLAREMAEANGFADRIRFVQGISNEIELPERVDGIVSDIRGTLPLFGTSLATLLDARDRFLKPDGWMVAARDTLWAAVVCSSSLADSYTKPWESNAGFDFSRARARASNCWRRESIRAADLLVPPKCWASIDYKSFRSLRIDGELCWTIERSGLGHGIAVWFDTETAPGLGFSNSPLSQEQHIYTQGYFPWREATDLAVGDQVRVRLGAHFVHQHYEWAWQTRVSDGRSGAIKKEYRQSSFAGAMLSPHTLRKRAHAFTPRPNEESRVDKRALELMDRGLTLGEIGRTLQAEFPGRFRDWNAALTKAADLSERYSLD